LRRNIDKNSIELISKCAKTRLHQCRILKKTGIPDLRFNGEKGMEGAGEMAERRRKADRWKATGIAHPLISA